MIPYFTTKKTDIGLGLATCYSILQRFGGKISCRNNPGPGCAFTIQLPAAFSPLLATSQRPEKQGAEAGLSAAILLIDDDAAILKVLSLYLKSRGCLPMPATDGAAGLAIIQRQQEAGKPIEAVLTDLTIPEKWGAKKCCPTQDGR